MRWMTVWVTFNTTFVTFWLINGSLNINLELPPRKGEVGLAEYFRTQPLLIIFSEDPDFVPECYE